LAEAVRPPLSIFRDPAHFVILTVVAGGLHHFIIFLSGGNPVIQDREELHPFCECCCSGRQPLTRSGLNAVVDGNAVELGDREIPAAALAFDEGWTRSG
jgi:hypothetical protein